MPATLRRTGRAVLAAKGLAGLILGGLLGAVVTVPLLSLVLVMGLFAGLFGAGRRWLRDGWPGRSMLALARLDRRRVRYWWDRPTPDGYGPAQAAGYLFAQFIVCALALQVLQFAMVGAIYTATSLWTWAFNLPPVEDSPPLPPGGIAGLIVFAVVSTALVVVALWGSVICGRWAAPRLLAGDPAALNRRIDELTVSRAAVIEAVDAERQRIERDLHDGVQQQVVALAMLLGRARRADGDRRARLLDDAHAQSESLVEDLRGIAWRVYPTALESLGLAQAVEWVADRCPVPVTVDDRLPAAPGNNSDPPADSSATSTATTLVRTERRLPRAVEAALYFTVSESLTNVMKHADASAATVELSATATGARVRIRDDGKGGARPDGAGLTGIRRRLEAQEGTLEVDSPPGGPTVITAEVPCDW